MNAKGVFLALWMLSVPVLGLVAMIAWFRRREALVWWRSAIGVGSILAVLANWGWFLWLANAGEVGGFGSHYLTTRSAGLYVLVPFAAIGASVSLESRSRALAILSSVLMFALWGGSMLVA